MKSIKEIESEITKFENEILMNTNRQEHFEKLKNKEMIDMYIRMNHDCITKIEILKWILI